MLNISQETFIRERILARNDVCDRFVAREAMPLAGACREMAARFLNGGRLFAFGRGPYATDAMHVSVEFIHPVIVGKRALPALDVSMSPDAWVESLVGEPDMAIGFGPPEGDDGVARALRSAKRRGAMTIAWPGDSAAAEYAVAAPSADPHVHQELFELLGHTMYESVHVFLEHLSRHDAVPAAQVESGVDFNFLYPFLDSQAPSEESTLDEVAASIRMKGRDANRLREEVASHQCERIAQAAAEIRERLDRGGRILAFGNGGSATDATDFALDCVMPENGWAAIPALSLAVEPAVITATANDVGVDVVFVRQLIAQSRACDVAMAFSTSGGSANVVAALIEARKRGLLTIALLGYDGGEIARRGLADFPLIVECDYVPRIQEAQGTMYHVLREALARA